MTNGTIGQNSDKEFQGTVALHVEATGSARSVASFVNTLRQKHHVRVLELAGNANDGVDILSVFRQPLSLVQKCKSARVQELLKIDGVSQVEVSPRAQESGSGHLVKVELANAGAMV